MLAAGCASTTEADSQDPTAGDESEIVGGKRDLRWSASGYLVKGSVSRLRRRREGEVRRHADCAERRGHRGARRARRQDGDMGVLGTGDAGQGELVKVVSTKVHPSFHEEAQGSFDLVHALRKYDVAMLTLEKPVRGGRCATLPNDSAEYGLQHPSDSGYSGTARMSAPACVMFRITLGRDPIFEVHPAESSALCIRDGDEGSAVVARDGNQQVLRGIFVGSVTQGFTDCKRGTQFLNGYESMFGYKDWLTEGIRAASTAC
ncbi:MAG: hypothetical protein QM760_02355 [Nibricoccus sp.]